MIITTVFYSLLVMLLDQAAGFDENRRNLHFTTRLFANILNLGIFIVPWVLFYYFYHYLVKSRRQQLDTLKLEALVRELELKTIKSHINPHFIFNALNSIRALIDENPNRARNAVTHLSNILRSSMQAEKLETVPFERELNIVKDYLALEYIRFEDRLKVEYDVNDETLSPACSADDVADACRKCHQAWYQRTDVGRCSESDIRFQERLSPDDRSEFRASERSC